MNIGEFFKKNWIHFAILATFLITMYAYFSVEFEGYGLKQHDVEQFKGMSNEIAHYREQTGEEPLWTNSMFGGMPATQISVIYKGNIFKQIVTGFMNLFPSPAGIFLLHLIGFYILGLCLRVKPVIAALGAFAFAFASYEIVILQAGHNSKAMAVAFTPTVLGAFIMAYRTSWKWGAALSGLFMTFELSMNHLQVTYYLTFVLFLAGVYFLVEAFRKKKLKEFGITSGAIIGGYLIALMINYGNISMTNSYAKHTIRGGNDLKLDINGDPIKKGSSGLDKDYITNWSYGVDESWTLVSPYVKGSHSIHISQTAFEDMVKNSDLPRAEQKKMLEAPFGLYYGDQPFTSGPVYLGVIVVFLSLLGLVLLKDPIKWVFFGVSVLALLLSWGKNFMPLTDFFIDHFPGYNKFRTVTIIMIVIELCLPVIGMLLLQKLWVNREEYKPKRNLFLIASGVFIIVLIGLKAVGLGDNYMSASESERMETDNLIAEQTKSIYAMSAQELQQYGIDKNNKQQMDAVIQQQVESMEDQFDAQLEVRKMIFDKSTTRSIVIGIFAVGIVALFFYTNLPAVVVVLGLIVLQLIDLVPVDRNYLGAQKDKSGKYVHWVERAKTAYPLSATPADREIMNYELAENPDLKKVLDEGEKLGRKKADELGYKSGDKGRVIDAYKFQALNMNTNYRVLELDNFWGSSRASYFHKSIGGYHGAKLRSIQNLNEFHISRSNNKVWDMLNIKYIVSGNQVSPRRTALGDAWLVREVETHKTPDEEIRALGAQMKISNLGDGKLYCAGKREDELNVFDGQSVKYILSTNDTIDVPLHNGVEGELKGYFVMDVNGKTGYVNRLTFENDSLKFQKLAVLERTNDFYPAKEAVMLETEAAKLSTKTFTGEGSIKMTSYAPNKIEYEADVKGKQLAVFSEIYYKDGWKAYIDGKEQPILEVDYLLRGLELTDGKHKIEFKFDLPAYHTAGTMAYIGSFLLIVLLGWLSYQKFREGNNSPSEKSEDQKD